jgi:uncharacterized membrane protein YecN with MAPEG domain
MLVLLLVAELNQANPLFLHTCGSIFRSRVSLTPSDVSAHRNHLAASAALH